MKPKKVPQANRSEIKEQVLGKFLRFRTIIFIIFVASIYAYVLIEVNNFSNVEPNPADVSSAQKIAIPKLDQSTVSKIESLQDNSVQVKALFDKARTTPFN